MQPGETVSRSPLDKPLHLLTEDDISQVTREDCRRFLKEKGMRRPSWNKAQAIQQVLSLKTLLETVPDSDSTRKLHIPRADIPPNPVPVSITASVKRTGADSQISASVEKSVPYRSTDFRNSNFVADQRRDDNVSVSRRISGTSNEPAAQMTIFYCGKVNVYDDVPRDKAQAILRLAASTLPSFQEASCDVISALCPSPCQVGTPGVKAAENSPTIIFPTLQTDAEEDIIGRTLFKLVMKGEWEKVIGIYSGIPAVHKFQITKSDDTALHIAVNDGQEKVVQELVDLIKSKGQDKAKEALKVGNERGNTPLHLAAALGNVTMCESIANVDSSLVSERNGDNETPVFLAALHGEKDVFLRLHDICGKCGQIQGSSYRRRSDGATILRAAIAGDYFDLAFQIIHLYKDLVNFVDEKGTSPLHLLASKPSAFKSSSHLFGFPKLVYNCTFVEELRAENVSNYQKPSSAEQSGNNSAVKYYPDNYKACADVVSLVLKAGKVLLTQSRENTNYRTRDTEKQEDDRSKGHQLIPPNYTCCYDLVKFFSKALLVIVEDHRT